MRRSTHIWVTVLVGGLTGVLVAALRPNLFGSVGVGVLVGLVIGTVAAAAMPRRARYRIR